MDMNILAPIIATAERDNPQRADDYLDEEGFLVLPGQGRVLDANRQPIRMATDAPASIF